MPPIRSDILVNLECDFSHIEEIFSHVGVRLPPIISDILVNLE